jgi:hypothetical protein
MSQNTPMTDAADLEIKAANPVMNNTCDWITRYNLMRGHAKSIELQLTAANETIATQREQIAELKTKAAAYNLLESAAKTAVGSSWKRTDGIIEALAKLRGGE